jgi:hypothetical protein
LQFQSSPQSAGYSQNKPIIGVAGISHESNSFNIKKTDLEDFSVTIGESQQERAKRFFAGSTAKTTSAGYIAGAKQFGSNFIQRWLLRQHQEGR